MKNILLSLFFMLTWEQAVAQEVTPRHQPGAEMTLYTPEQHQHYDGHFILSGGRVYQVGRHTDPPGWDHMGNDASNVYPVDGTVHIDVDEIKNTGHFVAHLKVPEGDLILELNQFQEFSPCQDGGLAAYLYEHGDAGCGDTNWPKTFVYIAGWGYGRATLNAKPLYQNYEMHFMVTQGMRDRETLVAMTGTGNSISGAGEVNPAAMQIDFYIRSPEANNANHPGREIFDHFFAMEVTWH